MLAAAKAAIYAQVAKAKLIYNKEKETYKVIIAFNVYERNKKGDLKFPVQKKCNYVSGDLNYETLQKDVANTIANAKKVLRTDNIVFVD
jgi:hypothetical protein